MLYLFFIPLLLQLAWIPSLIPVVMVLALVALTSPYWMWLRFVRQVRKAIFDAKNPKGSTKTVVRLVRRAIVVVGGDFARSPRMQYHAVSLSDATIKDSGKLFDEVVLLGYDCGNKLAEDVQSRMAKGAPSGGSTSSSATLTPITCEGLFTQPLPPQWYTSAVSKAGRKGAWAGNAVYKVLGLTLVLLRLLPSLMLPSVRRQTSDGGATEIVEVLIPQLVLCQTPPALPFVPLIKLVTSALSVIPDVSGRWAKLVHMELGNGTDQERNKSARGSRSSKAPKELITALPMWLSGFTHPALAVDWHNFGYTIMACDGRPSIMVAIYRAVERQLCQGQLNLTVSEAMREALSRTDADYRRAGKKKPPPPAQVGSASKLVIVEEEPQQNRKQNKPTPPKSKTPRIIPFGFPIESVTVLHDHSPRFFKPVTASEFTAKVLPAFEDKGSVALDAPPSWLRPMLDAKGQGESGANDAPKGRILVASTSWTADDDYTIVIDALKGVDASLVKFNATCEEEVDKRRLWFVATGKGIARARFEQQVKDAKFSQYVTVSVIYFQSLATYAAMLGGADAGLSLHYSSSGLDLPMKCVDMLGAGIPVFSLRYPAIHELVDEEGRAGWLFSDAKELASAIFVDLLGTPSSSHLPPCDASWSKSAALLKAKRAFIAVNHGRKWDEDWDAVALPAIERLVRGKR